MKMRRNTKKKIYFWKKVIHAPTSSDERQTWVVWMVSPIVEHPKGSVTTHSTCFATAPLRSAKAGRQSQSNDLLFCIVVGVACAHARHKRLRHAMNSVEDVCSLHGNDASAMRIEGECYYWIGIHWCVIACHTRFEPNIGFTGNRVKVNQFEQRQRQRDSRMMRACIC